MVDPQTVSIFVDVQNIYYTTRQQYKRNFEPEGSFSNLLFCSCSIYRLKEIQILLTVSE